MHVYVKLILLCLSIKICDEFCIVRVAIITATIIFSFAALRCRPITIITTHIHKKNNKNNKNK